MGILRRVPTIIGPALLAYIFIRYINISELANIYGSSSPVFLLTSCLFNIMLLLGKIHRLHFLLKKNSVTVGFFTLAKTYATSNLLGQISNVLVSDVVNAGVLMLHHEKKTRISSIFAIARISDLISVTGLCCICLYLNYGLLQNHLTINSRPLVALSVVLLVLLSCLLFFRSKIMNAWQDFLETARGALPTALLYCFVIYIFYILSALYDAKALHLQMSTSYIMLIYMMGSLITVVPISIAGIGTRDLLFIFLMNLVTISADSAVALSSLGFLIMPLLSLVFIYLLSLFGIRYENSCHS